MAAWAAVSLFVRRLPRFSRAAVVANLVAYATMPVVVPLLQLAVDDIATPPSGTAAGLLEFVVFAAVFLATTYGLGTLLHRAVRHTIYDLRNSVRLLGRALPAILFVTLSCSSRVSCGQSNNPAPVVAAGAGGPAVRCRHRARRGSSAV